MPTRPAGSTCSKQTTTTSSSPSPQAATGTMDGDVRLASTLSQFWLVRGGLTEGRGWLEDALARYPPPDPLRVKTLWALGHLACFAGDYDRAVAAADEACALARRLDSRRWEARADMLLGLAASGLARPGEAEQRHRAAVEGARAAGDRWCYACALNNLGNVLALQGATAAARDSYEESLAVRRHEGDAWGMSWVLFRLGVLATWECRFAEATALLEESLQQSDDDPVRSRHPARPVGPRRNLHATGDDRDAACRFADALATARQLKENTGAGVALAGLASVALASGDLDRAARWLNEPEADRLATRSVPWPPVPRCCVARAALAAARGDDQRAEALHLDALRLRQLLGDNRAIIEELEALAITAACRGRQPPRRRPPRGDRTVAVRDAAPCRTRDEPARDRRDGCARRRRRHARRGVAGGT